MMKYYNINFSTECKDIEAYSEEQIKDLLSFTVGKALPETFGILSHSSITIDEIKEIPDSDGDE
jgi:hypothetical protein